MKEYLLHISLFLKRQFNNRIYACFLILLPICLFGVRYFLLTTGSSSLIPVGYYFDFDDNELETELTKSFTAVSGKLNFIKYKDLDKMLNDTAGTRLECSYILTENLIDKIAEDDYKKVILVYKSPQTIISDMINELVFAAVYRVAGENILYSYLEHNPVLYENIIDTSGLLAAITSEYSDQLEYGNTFSLNYNIYDGQNLNTRSESDSTTKEPLPVHGIIAIFLFLCLLLACSDYVAEAEKGTFNKFPFCKRIITGSCLIHSWLFPASIASMTSIILLHGFNNFSKELLIMLFYYLILLVFGIILITLIKSSILIAALLPIFIIGSLIFTPIIIDVSVFWPAAGFIEKLFLPYYYIFLQS